MGNTYFDNASTSFPKPEAVTEAVVHYLHHGGTYGRAATHRVLENTRTVEECREALAQLLGVIHAEQIAFTLHATAASNAILKGVEWNPKTTVYVSPMEHNAIMRVLHALNLSVVVLPALSDGSVNVSQLKHIVPRTIDWVIINHQSNVNGVIQPLQKIAEWAHPATIMVDASQSLGITPIDVEKWGIDFVIFTGHKSLLGPTGVGGFYAADPRKLTPAIHGGTGSNSTSYDMPPSLPDRMEAGTPNIMSISGLLAAIKNTPIPQHSHNNILDAIHRISQIEGITVHGAIEKSNQGSVFSITHVRLLPSQLCTLLYENHRIETRQGLHCSPLAHHSLGTFPHGTVRLSLSPYHTSTDIEYLINAIDQCVKQP